MKTYSVAIKTNKGVWITNYDEFLSLDEIDWKIVENFCKVKKHLAYGYYYGHNSRKLTSDRCRTVLKTLDVEV